jgi:hypothetical protein
MQDQNGGSSNPETYENFAFEVSLYLRSSPTKPIGNVTILELSKNLVSERHVNGCINKARL